MDGAQEHELEEWTTGRTTQPRAPGNPNIIDRATGLLIPPPPYQSAPRQNEANQNVASETSHPTPTPSTRVRPRSKWSCRNTICCIVWLFIVALVVFIVCAIVLSADLAADSGSEYTTPPKVFRRSDLQPSPTKFSAVSGLYIIPATTTTADWLRAVRSRGEPEISTTSNLEDIAWNLKAVDEVPPVAVSHGWREPELVASDKVTFNRWGVEILYRLHRRAINAVQIQKGWCMKNVCSKDKVLSVMCRKQHKDMDRFEHQECDWCWSEEQRAERTSLQKDEIAKHCETVSHQAAKFLLVVCGLLLVSGLAILAILIFRLWSSKKARTEFKIAPSDAHWSNRCGNFWPLQSVSHLVKPSGRAGSSDQENLRAPWYQSVFRKLGGSLKTNGGDKRCRTRLQKRKGDPSPLDDIHPVNEDPIVPIMPSSRIFSNRDNMGQRTPPGTEEPKGQCEQRRSPRRSEAVSSGSEHISMTDGISMTRRSFGGEPGLAEARKDITSTTRFVEHH